MNAELNENAAEMEFLEDLKRLCQFARRSKVRPDKAIPAAKWEMKINVRLDELHQLETPPLPLGKHQRSAVAA